MIFPITVSLGFDNIFNEFLLSESIHENLVPGLCLRQVGHDEKDLLELAETPNPAAYTDRAVLGGIEPPRRTGFGLVRFLTAIFAPNDLGFPGERRQSEAEASQTRQRRPVSECVATREGSAAVPDAEEAGKAEQVVVRVHYHVGNTGLEHDWRLRNVVVEKLALFVVRWLGAVGTVDSDWDIYVLRSAMKLFESPQPTCGLAITTSGAERALSPRV